jgi:hypothetical protein
VVAYITSSHRTITMYGPTADPSQRIAPVEIFDVPEAYIFCFAVGGLITALAWRRNLPVELRAAFFILGQCIFLTAPLAFFVDTFVYGSFPTIDKAGSMAHYLDGVHLRAIADPIAALSDPAVQLIGVHMGHLVTTSFFDLFLSPVGAFNIQALLFPALAWYFAWWLFWEHSGSSRAAMLMSFPFGMGLHIFRDLNWYTIEKAAIFWIPLFVLVCTWAVRRGLRWRWAPAVVLALSTWTNVYLGMMGGAILVVIFVSLWVTRHPQRHRITMASAGAVVAVLPLVLAQWMLMADGPQLASKDAFLWQRAALDSFSLNPLAWNRLEVHRSLNLVALALAAWGMRAGRWKGVVPIAGALALLFFFLSLGPILWAPDVSNPVYMGVRAVVPGFWRVAKPEVFFHVTWLMLLGIAAIECHRLGLTKRTLGLWYIAFVAAWLVMARSHPAYPPMTMPVATALDPDWAERVFGP